MFLSPHLTLSFSASTLTSLFGPSVPQSSLLHSLRAKPSSGFISIGGGEIKPSDPGRGVIVVVIVVVEDRWISGRVLEWVRVGNLENGEHGILFVGVDFNLNGSDQPLLWSTLGFGLNGSRFWLDLGFDQSWEWETKNSQSLGLRDLGFNLMVAGWWWRWLVLRERERER